MIGRSGERGSGISVLAARHDDDDDFKIASNFSITLCVCAQPLPVQLTSTDNISVKGLDPLPTTSVLDMTLKKIR